MEKAEAKSRKQNDAFTLEPIKRNGSLDQIFNESPLLMALTVGPHHVIEHANQKYFEVLNLNSSIIGKTLKEVFPEIESQGFIKLLDDVLKTGRAFRSTEALVKLKRPDGTERIYYFDFAYQPVRDASGNVYGIIHQGYEITELVLARQAVERSKAAIENERENFRNLFKRTPEMVCILGGADHVFEFVNEAHIRTVGSDSTGKSAREVRTGAIEVIRILDEVYQTGRTIQIQEFPIKTGGQIRYFNITYSARRNARGQIDGVMFLGREITDELLSREALKNAAVQLESAVAARTRELKESQSFLDSVIENLPSMVFVKSAKDLRFVRLNKAGEDLLGISRLELIGKNDYDFFPKTKADFFVSKDREVLQGRSIVDIPEEPIKTQNKGARILHTRKIPIFSTSGKPEYLLGISEDITDAKKAQEERHKVIREQTALEERRRENERASFLAEASTTLAKSLDYRKTLKDIAHLIVPVFADWCTVTIVREDRSKDRVAIAHRDPSKCGLIEELEKYYPASVDETSGIGKVIRTGESGFNPVVLDSALVAAARDPRHLEIMRGLGVQSCIIVPLTTRGRILGAIALVSSREHHIYNENDLALAEELGRRAATAIDNAFLYESAQNAIRVRDEFLSIASHELKTPLTSLKLQAQMRKRNLEKGNWEAFTHERLVKLIRDDEKQVTRLTSLVDDMLDISRINSGKFKLVPEEFDLSHLVEEVIERFNPQLQNSSTQIEVGPHPKAVGFWDRYRIEQILINLLTNAVKYGLGKPIQVEVTMDKSSAHLFVRDQGIGIAKKDQRRIFDQFERAVTPTEVSGLGLGLYIARQLAEAHGGGIRVESELGLGSVFILDLPLRATSEGDGIVWRSRSGQ